MPGYPTHIDAWSSDLAAYNALHPNPPHVLIDFPTQLLGKPGLFVVADIGCGTGLSTRL